MTRFVDALRVAPVTAGIIVAAISVSNSAAQVAEARPAVPAGTSANWWDVPAPIGAERNTPSASPPGSLFRHDAPTSPYATSITDYPSAQMGDWVVANAMAARARAMRDRAQSELNQALRRVTDRFEHSDEFTKASIAEKQAYAEYIAARQKVLVQLFNDSKYHAIMQLCDELSEKITTRRQARADETDIDNWLKVRGFDPSKLTGEQMVTLKALYDSEQRKTDNVASDTYGRNEIVAMATLKMQYASDARAIEVAALSSDENVKTAHAKMVDASRRLTDLRAQFEFSLRDNPEMLVARHNLDDARISVIEASALAQGAAIASDYARNYAYYLHRNDNNGLYGPSNPYQGTLAGYVSPYWGR